MPRPSSWSEQKFIWCSPRDNAPVTCVGDSGGVRRLRARAPDALLIALLSALSGLSLVGTALAPALLGRHALLLVALAPRYPFLAVAAARTPAAPFLLVACARLLAADAPNFVLARRHGGRLSRAASRWALTKAVHRTLTVAFARLGVLAVACSPTGRVLALAGASGMAPGRVAAADVLGTAAQVVAVWAVVNGGLNGGRPAPVVCTLLACAAAAAGVLLALRAAARVLSIRLEEASTCVCW
jgi:hypothetical protein